MGGSGTRMVALMPAELGLSIGRDLNESSDNLPYTPFARDDAAFDPRSAEPS